MDRHHDKIDCSIERDAESIGGDHQSPDDDWVHEIIAMTRPGAEIEFPVRAIDDREIPFVYDDFC